MNLKSMGWSDFWKEPPQDLNLVAKIVSKNRGFYVAITGTGSVIHAHLSGKMQYAAASSSELPAIGDWCLLSPEFIDESGKPSAIVEQVLERKSFVSRMAAGTKAETQVLASNVDVMFIVTSMNDDFSINRLRRFSVLAQAGNVEPIVVLSKTDLGGDLEKFIHQIRESLPNVRCFGISSLQQQGIDFIVSILTEGKTGVLVGSSGVGKSTLINVLLDSEVQKTKAVREEDSKGRHTTSGGYLFFLNSGGMIIDTPGLREVHLIGEDNNLEETFPKVQEASLKCKFTDCTHVTEPGCGIRAALEDGTLTQSDLEEYGKLQKEMAFARRKVDKVLATEEKKKWKSIHKGQRLKRKIEGR